MKKQKAVKKSLFMLLCAVVMIFVLMGTHAMAAFEPVTINATLSPSSLNAGSSEQTITLTVTSAQDIVLDGIEYQIVPSWQGAVITSTAGVAGNNFAASDIGTKNGNYYIAWSTSDLNNVTTKSLGTFTITVPANVAAGTYNVQVLELETTKDYGDDGYRGSATATLTINSGASTNPIDQTITAADVTTTYGATNAKISATASGNGALSYSVVTGADVVSVSNTGALTIKKAGTATVKINAAATATHNAAEKTVTVTVQPVRIQKPAASNKTFTYSGREQTYPVTTNSAYTVSGDKQKNAGNYTVTVALQDKDNYLWNDGTTTDVTFPFVIGKAKITITAKNKSAYIDAQVPALGANDYSVSGLVSGDQLVKQPTLAYASAPDMSKAGSVAIVPSGADAGDNYTIEYKNGTLTISQQGGGGGGGGGGGAAAPATSAVTVAQAANGSVSVNPTSAKAGDKVTVTATANTGYETDAVTVTDKDGKAVSVTKNSDGTYSFTMPEGTVNVTASFKEKAAAPQFVDVDSGKWYYSAVNYVAAKGLMQGVDATRFAPDADTTRAMLVTILYRLEGEPAVSGNGGFNDVKNGQWYTSAIAWAAANGIVEGYADGDFGIDDPITREQLAAIMYRYAKYKKYDVSKTNDLSAFSDSNKVSGYATEAMKWAVASGLIEGDGGKLAPQGNASRAEIAAILMRFCENVK